MLTALTLIHNQFKSEFEIYVANIIKWNTVWRISLTIHWCHYLFVDAGDVVPRKESN